ncbi:MAG: phosphoribosyl-AMP cyclohydrolase [Erythrobacter sp.]
MDTSLSPDTLRFAVRESVEMIELGNQLAPRFDAAGLIPVITCDDATGEVLMLGNMTAEALRLTLTTGEVHYFSRTRQALWRKGEHSGFIHRLVELRVDDDQDCLLARVALEGPGSCHVGYYSCFYRAVERDALAEDAIISLRQLETEAAFDAETVYAGLPNPTKI